MNFDLFSLIHGNFLIVLALYGAGILIPFFFPRQPRFQNLVAHGAAMSASAAGIVLGVLGLFANSPLVFYSPSTLPLFSIQFRLDTLSSFFVLLISLSSFPVSLYAVGYVREYEGRYPVGLIGGLYNAFVLSMTLVVMADNGFLFLILWEMMSLVSYFLVVTEHEKAETRYAGFFYLVMTHVGTVFIMICFLLFYQQSGSFAFEAFRSSGLAIPQTIRTLVFLTALVGFGTKAGIVPLHVWLPYAHPAAPSHVSALMSGVMIKTAIYGLVRVYFDLLGGQFPWWWGFTILVVGAVSALLGVMYALMEHDLKSLLAYHSVENIGIILLGIGAGMIFQSYGLSHLAALGLLAGLYHTINHAMFKGLLFLGAGSLLYSTHTRNMEEYGGLIRKMPWTALFFLIGAVSISGLPPSNGFISEWLTFQSLFLSFQIPDLLMKIFLPIGAAMLALTGALAMACFAKAFGISFLAMPRSPHAKQAAEVPVVMRIGMGIMAAYCVILGLVPMLVVPVLDRVIAPFTHISIANKVITGGGWTVEPMGVKFASISTPALALIMGLLIPLTLLLIVALSGRVRKRFYRTWGCGLNLKPRNEYTSTGFVQPIRQIFSMIYRPTVKLEAEMMEESRYFARRKRFELSFQPVFQRYLYDPVVRVLLAVAGRFRVIQAGSLHLYLSYIFLTLIALLLWAR
ncbi:MAG: hydrogenase 4 subunit B [Nitrospirae bacterium]|nr:hydrogenase 4 subunit B [Nitrospirota bacterium]MBI3352891.1 hydrogenase 4 subunit B [Nitrospirota bacterium]